MRKFFPALVVVGLLAGGTACAVEHVSVAGNPVAHTVTGDARALALHKAATSAAAQREHAAATAARKSRKAAARALAYACRPIPGANAIVVGSTVAECRHNRAMTVEKIREEQAHPARTHSPDPYEQEWEIRKNYFTHHPPHRAKPSDCPAGTKPVGETGACA